MAEHSLVRRLIDVYCACEVWQSMDACLYRALYPREAGAHRLREFVLERIAWYCGPAAPTYREACSSFRVDMIESAPPEKLEFVERIIRRVCHMHDKCPPRQLRAKQKGHMEAAADILDILDNGIDSEAGRG